MKKENDSNESDSSENEIPDLNSLKPFGFEPKTNIRYISSSQKQSAKAFYKRPKSCNFNKKDTLTQVFSCEFCKISRKTFLYKHLRTTASE